MKSIVFDYEYPPLDLTTNQIRLLQIIRQPDSGVQYSLETFDIATCPPYITLSYVWRDDEPSHTLVINGQAFLV